MDIENMSDEYLYLTIDSKQHKLMYIGKGKGERYKHITSGISSCRAANEYYFKTGTQDLKVFKIPVTHSAIDYENALIFFCQPEWNICGKEDYPFCSGEIVNSAARFSLWLDDFRIAICNLETHIVTLIMTCLLYGGIDIFKDTYNYYNSIKDTHPLLL